MAIYDPSNYKYTIENVHSTDSFGKRELTVYLFLSTLNSVCEKLHELYTGATTDALNDIRSELSTLDSQIRSDFSGALNLKTTDEPITEEELGYIADAKKGDVYSINKDGKFSFYVYMDDEQGFVPLSSGGGVSLDDLPLDELVTEATFSTVINGLQSVDFELSAQIQDAAEKVGSLLDDYEALEKRVASLESLDFGDSGLNLGEVADIKNFADYWSVDAENGNITSETADILFKDEDGETVSMKDVAKFAKPSTSILDPEEGAENIYTMMAATEQDLFDFVFKDEVNDGILPVLFEDLANLEG